MAIKKLTYVIEVDTESGKVKIDGLTKGFINAETAAKRLYNEISNVNKNLSQGASKAGLAGAAITELGRTISDSNYGMMAMANNLQQLSTLFITLISTSGGLTKALGLLWRAFMGPLGLIVVFQIAIAWLEKLDKAKQMAASGANKVGDAISGAATELKVMLELDNDLTDQQIQNTEDRIAALVAEAKVRAQIQLIQEKQIELARLQKKPISEFASFWDALWMEVKQLDPSSGRGGLKESTILALMGLGRESKDANVKAITDEIAQIMADINPKDLQNLINRKSGSGGSKGGKATWVEAISFGLKRDISGATPEEINEGLRAVQVVQGLTEYLIQADRELTEAEREESEKRIAQARLEMNQRLDMLSSIGEGMVYLGQVVGRETALGKGIAAAGALIDTYAAATAILKNAAKTPAGGIPGYAIAQAVATVAFGLAQVRQILSVRVPGRGGSGSSSAGNATGTTIRPQFNIVGSSNASQLRDAVEGQLNRPVKAYVTTKDIRSNEELDRNTRRGATIG